MMFRGRQKNILMPDKSLKRSLRTKNILMLFWYFERTAITPPGDGVGRLSGPIPSESRAERRAHRRRLRAPRAVPWAQWFMLTPNPPPPPGRSGATNPDLCWVLEDPKIGLIFLIFFNSRAGPFWATPRGRGPARGGGTSPPLGEGGGASCVEPAIRDHSWGSEGRIF